MAGSTTSMGKKLGKDQMLPSILLNFMIANQIVCLLILKTRDGFILQILVAERTGKSFIINVLANYLRNIWSFPNFYPTSTKLLKSLKMFLVGS